MLSIIISAIPAETDWPGETVVATTTPGIGARAISRRVSSFAEVSARNGGVIVAHNAASAAYMQMNQVAIDSKPDRFAFPGNGQDATTLTVMRERDGGNHLVAQMKPVTLLAG
ncbi:hypothetical protein ABIF24_002577 [Bradyrhizobium elkanii]|uniref:hypothetical protein n=1 Tax=Bradyrhizobium elkanii TaxID=29448 RepID=UPI0035121D99